MGIENLESFRSSIKLYSIYNFAAAILTINSDSAWYNADLFRNKAIFRQSEQFSFRGDLDKGARIWHTIDDSYTGV